MPDLDVAENLGASADHHAVADLRVTVLVLLAGAAERHTMQDRHIILDHRGLAHHQAGGMVEEDGTADRGSRIDVALEDRRGAALQIKREVLTAFAEQPMRQPVGLNRVEAFVVENRLDVAAGFRIAVAGSDDVSTEDLAERRLLFERVIVSLPDEIAGNVGIAKSLGDAMDQSSFERVVMQDVLVDEGSELRLASRGILRLAADARPHRVDLVQSLHRPCLKLSHGSVLLGSLSDSYIGLLSHFGRDQEGGRKSSCRTISWAFIKKRKHAALEHLVADREHVVAAGDRQCLRAWDECRQ